MEPQNNTPVNPSNPIVTSTQKDKINNVKYILYNILLVVIIFFLWWYAQDYYNQYTSQKVEIVQLMSWSDSLKTELKSNEDIADILSSMSGKNNIILQCINDNICDQLDTKISKNIDNIRSYYIISNMWTSEIKSDVINNDININLLSNSNGESLWSIDSLSIKKSTMIDKRYNIKKVPIEITIKFNDNSKLVKFLQNVEKTISANWWLLYKINDVYYNFTSDEWLRVSMDLYYVENTKKTNIPNTGDQQTWEIPLPPTS